MKKNPFCLGIWNKMRSLWKKCGEAPEAEKSEEKRDNPGDFRESAFGEKNQLPGFFPCSH